MLLGGRSAARGRCVSRRRAPRALPHTGRAELVFKAVCARADSSDCGPTRNEYCAGQRTDKLARPMGKAMAAAAGAGEPQNPRPVSCHHASPKIAAHVWEAKNERRAAFPDTTSPPACCLSDEHLHRCARPADKRANVAALLIARRRQQRASHCQTRRDLARAAA